MMKNDTRHETTQMCMKMRTIRKIMSELKKTWSHGDFKVQVCENINRHLQYMVYDVNGIEIKAMRSVNSYGSSTKTAEFPGFGSPVYFR